MKVRRIALAVAMSLMAVAPGATAQEDPWEAALRALLPAEIGGQPLLVVSDPWIEEAGGTPPADLATLVTRYGLTDRDLHWTVAASPRLQALAEGGGSDLAKRLAFADWEADGLTIYAYTLDGIPADDLLSDLLAMNASQSHGLIDWQIAGRRVATSIPPSGTEEGWWFFYPYQEFLFLAHGHAKPWWLEVLAALPAPVTGD